MITRIPTSVCIYGDKIAEDVYDFNGTLLLEKNTVIDNTLKNDLMSLGIANLNIYSPITESDDQDKLHSEMLREVRDSLSGVLFRKEYMYTRITNYLAHMYESINDNPFVLKALYRIKKTDDYTFTHSINTSFYSMFIAMWMGLSDQQIINATQAGILHDIGKMFIPSEILNKAGRLTSEEYEIIKKHTLYGYFLLNESGEFNQEVKRAVLFHHERTDSCGYPMSAMPDYVGIISKIVAVADVYDAMTTDRVYKKASAPLEAIEFLSKDGMKILDNDVLKVFLEKIPIYDFKANTMWM